MNYREMRTHFRIAGGKTKCGRSGPFVHSTFEAARVTCPRCIARAGTRLLVAPRPKTPGRVVQPGGGRGRA
jgi:DNA-directed RNA polymerase subunit RPC12/RpoP